VLRFDYSAAYNLIGVLSSCRFEHYQITASELPKAAKECIAMSGQRDCTQRFWTGTLGKVAYRVPQSRVINAFLYNRRPTNARNCDPSKWISTFRVSSLNR
jgi:hypothetical protein